MPLRNEEFLRETLDSLFYEDSIKFRLKLVDRKVLELKFTKELLEEEDAYFSRICKYVSQKFGGYSIHHVNGRFRAAELMTHTQASGAERYLIDETTAVVRFILPCQKTDVMSAEQDAELTRWFFEELFVQSILEVVNAEDEIWLLESGMQHRLHIWRAKD